MLCHLVPWSGALNQTGIKTMNGYLIMNSASLGSPALMPSGAKILSAMM